MRMNLVIIIGAQAVGKMAVGYELEKLTDLKLFHNHMSIELGLKFDQYGAPLFNEINRGVRELVMDAFIKHKKGLIFTFVWGFSLKSDWEYMEYLREKFKNYKIHYVELIADIEVRLIRNEAKDRLSEKPSKRNIEWSRNELLKTMDKYRLVSYDGEIPYDNYIKIDNTNLTVEETAKFIKDKFDL
jgi:hypothetical protein